jgi:hypothetical protein
MEFNVGDRVRLVKDTNFAWHVIGEEGEIIDFDDYNDDPACILVNFDSLDREGDRGCYVRNDMIEKVV